MPKKPKPLPMTNDVPFIVCDVCQKAAKTLFKNIRQKRKETVPLKMSEEDILNVVEKTCDPEHDHGNWITKLDVAEEKDKLKIVEHPKQGRCLEECKTIQYACESAIGDIDTDIGEILWKDEFKLASFVNEVCYSLSKKCSSKNNNKKWNGKGKRKDQKFIEMGEKELEAHKVMQNMKGIPGMPGMEMYSREDIAAMQEQMGGQPQPPSEEADPVEDDTPEGNHSSNVSFLDFIKQIGRDIARKVKQMIKSLTETVNWLFGTAGKKKKKEL